MLNNAAIPKLALTPHEAAAALGVSERTLWTMTHETRELPALKVGRNTRYHVAALNEYLVRAKQLQDWLERLLPPLRADEARPMPEGARSEEARAARQRRQKRSRKANRLHPG